MSWSVTKSYLSSDPFPLLPPSPPVTNIEHMCNWACDNTSDPCCRRQADVLDQLVTFIHVIDIHPTVREDVLVMLSSTADGSCRCLSRYRRGFGCGRDGRCG